MLGLLINWQLNGFAKRYGYDVGYLRAVAAADPLAMLRFSGIAGVSNYRRGIPADPYFAAKLRAIVLDDCGPCTQLVANMALEAGVREEIVSAILRRDYADLAPSTRLAALFAEFSLAHRPEADDLRDEVVALWGQRGLVSIAFAVSSARVYPALKYALGHGKACVKVNVGANSVAPLKVAHA